jgi:hypothetical protein
MQLDNTPGYRRVNRPLGKKTPGKETPGHGRINYKDTKPYMSAFLSVDLLTDFAAFCLTDFIDWRYIHSWFVFSTQLVNCCPHACLCTVAPLLYLLSDLFPPFPMYSIYRQCVTGGGGMGGVEMYCGPYSAGVYTLLLTRFRTYKIASPPQTKITSKDDIKGLVSLKFPRPCPRVF